MEAIWTVPARRILQRRRAAIGDMRRCHMKVLEDMLRSREGELADLERQVATVDKRIADLDPQLHQEVLRERTAQIRSEAVKLLDR